MARRLFLFINKAWGYGDSHPDHYFLALNYRMSELQGAVAVAQLPKLAGGVETRIRMADKLTQKLGSLKGVVTPKVGLKSAHSYWKYCLRVDGKEIPGGPIALARDLKIWVSIRLRVTFRNPRSCARSFRSSGPLAIVVIPLLLLGPKLSITTHLAFQAPFPRWRVSWSFPGMNATPMNTWSILRRPFARL